MSQAAAPAKDSKEAKPQEDGAQSNQLNPPKINPATGKPEQRAISTAKQAYGVAKSIRDRAVESRVATAGVIADKYDGAAPYNAKALERAGQGWRNNFSTNFLASIIDRVVPQLTEPMKTADYLIYKSLPPKTQDAASKARKYNDVVTKAIRAWPEWEDTIDGLAQEVVLFGNAVATCLDRDWRPRVWRYDEVFLPEGTGQHATKVQVGAFGQTFLLHEFMELFKDKGIAEKAGYNYDGCVKVANETVGGKGTDETPLEAQDAIREQSVFGYSYNSENQTRTVKVYHVPVRDYSGEIDLWMVAQGDGTEIRQSKGHHAAMRDCMCLFTMQRGNRKFYGSKGLGRLITNLHIAIERNRNVTADKVNMDGYPIMKSDDPAGAQLQLRYPFMVAGTDTIFQQEEISCNWEASEGLDNKLTGIAESIAGAFIPPNVDQSGSSKTKIEAAQKAERDLAVRQGVLTRFNNQGQELTDMMCRAMLSPLALREGKRAWEEKKAKEGNKIKIIARAAWKLLKKAFGDKQKDIEPTMETAFADEIGVQVVVDLLDAGLTVDEIALLTVAPSSQSNAEEGAGRDAQTLQYIQTNRANPNIDQRKASEMEANIVLGETRASELLIPVDDPNVKNKAIRDQTIELSEMLDGNPMPVVGSDNHGIHRQALAPNLEGLVEAIQKMPNPELIKGAKLAIQHYDEHLEQDALIGPEQKQQERQVIQGWWQTVAEYEAKLTQAAAEITAQRAAGQAPGQPGPEGAPQAPEPQPQGDELERAASLALETKRVSQADRKLTLEEQKHKDNTDLKAMELQQTNMQILADQAKHSREAGLKEAEQDLAATSTQV